MRFQSANWNTNKGFCFTKWLDIQLCGERYAGLFYMLQSACGLNGYFYHYRFALAESEPFL